MIAFLRTFFLLGLCAFSLATASGQSQGEMNAQAWKSFQKADAKLNSIYKKLIAELDAESQAKLKVAQRAWIAFRDAESDFQADMDARGGSMAPLIRSTTAQELTEKRIAQLSASLKESDVPVLKK